MNLVCTTFHDWERRRERPPWMLETNSLATVSCQNILLFTTTTCIPPDENGLENGIYCTDLNSPWDVSLVCKLSATPSSLCWDKYGTKFCVGDTAGNIAIWKMSTELCLSDWEQVYAVNFPNERILKAGFLSSSRGIRLNSDKKDLIFYNEKFKFGPQVESNINIDVVNTDVCIFVTSTGLLTAVVFNQNIPSTITTSVGRTRCRLEFVDLATSSSGQHLLAVCGSETPVTLYQIYCTLGPQEGLKVHVANHSSFCVSEEVGQESVRISALKFVLNESTNAITVGVDGVDGGKVRMWELEYNQLSCHKLFSQSTQPPSRKLVPTWKYCSEFSGAGSKLVCLATPNSSVMGGEKPSCYIVVGFADGTIQCLIRDSLQQIASVELPRSGNMFVNTSSNVNNDVTICDMCFTSTGTGLLVTDSLGQLYLYRMSPIADPGGPHVAAYLVTMYEYCLVSGRDWWDLALAASLTNIQTVADKLEETYMKQPAGVRNFFFYRYMSIRSSLFRLCPQSHYRAGDIQAIMMLKSIHGDLGSMLNVDLLFIDQEPVDKLSTFLRTVGSATDLDTIVSGLASKGYVRDLGALSDGFTNLYHLGNWVITLALHILSAVPEYKTRRGPGYWLLQEGGLGMMRDILVILRLWGIPKANFITREKDLDLNSKIFTMLGKLKESPEDETLLDECLILPSQVIVPGLDVMVSPTGVLAGIKAGNSLPFTFYYGNEPDFFLPAIPLFLEGLPYTEDNGRTTYDTVNKIALGSRPAKLKRCNRCKSFTQSILSTSGSPRSWGNRWNTNCCCGGSWSLVKTNS